MLTAAPMSRMVDAFELPEFAKVSSRDENSDIDSIVEEEDERIETKHTNVTPLEISFEDEIEVGRHLNS